MGCFKRTVLKPVYYLGWNRSPAQVGCMRQVLGPGALGRPRGIGWRGRWEGRSGWGIHVYPRLIHVNVWQKPLQYCRVVSLQLIKKKIKRVKKKKKNLSVEKWKTEISTVNRALYFKISCYNHYFSFPNKKTILLSNRIMFNYLLNKCWWHISLQNLILGGLNSLFSNLQGKKDSQFNYKFSDF